MDGGRPRPGSAGNASAKESAFLSPHPSPQTTAIQRHQTKSSDTNQGEDFGKPNVLQALFSIAPFHAFSEKDPQFTGDSYTMELTADCWSLSGLWKAGADKKTILASGELIQHPTQFLTHPFAGTAIYCE